MDYKKEILGDDYKKVLLEAITYFDWFCKQENLTYYLAYGTLIGAVRHNGFIPWDDDIDIFMFRDEYNRLLEIFNDNNSHYRLISFENNSKFKTPLAKIIDTNTILIQNYGYKEEVDLGAYIDVFVLDNLPNEIEKAKDYHKKCRKLVRRWMYANSKIIRKGHCIPKELLRSLLHCKEHILGEQYYLRKIKRFALKYHDVDSTLVGNITFAITEDIWFKSDFEPVEHVFENTKLIIPKGYDRILTMRFGNWRELPEEKDRISHHDFKCYYY